MKILLFTHTFSPVGGVETWLDRACEYLPKQGFDPIVGLVRGQCTNQPERFKAAHPQLTTVEIDGRGLNRVGRVRALARCIRMVHPRIVSPLGIVDGNEATIRCKQHGMDVRLLVHAQGNLVPMLADLRAYRDWIDLVVCPGRLTSRVLLDWAGFDRDRVRHIPNGAEPARRNRTPRSPGAPLRIGYVGRLTDPDKRATDLIRLHEELDRRQLDYRLEIVGDGPCLGKLQEALSGASRVTLHGAVLHEELYEGIFPNLDVLVLTSSSEAFGIVLVEAMMHGVVPLTSRYDGFYAEGLVKESFNGLAFDVGDMAAAADALQGLAGDASLLERLSARSLEMAASYTWSRSLTRWTESLRSAATRPPVTVEQVPEIPRIEEPGRLEQLRLPAGAVDLLRRARRALLGPAVPPGGEEWPLFYRHHTPEVLGHIRRALDALDRPVAHGNDPQCIESVGQ